MGVDISGKNPIIRSPKPKTPNWQTASEQEKETLNWIQSGTKKILAITFEQVGGVGDH
jgi:hypothetical protein